MVPDLPFEQPEPYKSRFFCRARVFFSRLGCFLLTKRFESVIQAMPSILARHSNAVYMIAGATHPASPSP